MGGGRDNNGAARYKRVNGKYVLVGAYKDKEKEATRLIAEILDRPIDENTVLTYFSDTHGYGDRDAVIVTKRPISQIAVLNYLRAIDARDRNAVIEADKKLKNGDYGTGEDQEKISNIRKTLLELAKESPEKISQIRKSSFHKAAKMITANEKLKKLQERFLGKKIKLKNDVKVGNYESRVKAAYEKGLEGTVLKIRQHTYELPDPDNANKKIKTVSYEFLLQWGDGYKKWVSGNDIEPIN